MAQTRKQVLRWLRNLRPEKARKVLRDPRFHTELFLSLYLERCDEKLFHDLDAGLLLAEIAPELAALIQAPERRRRELLVRAWAVLGGAYRRSGHHDRAEDAYRQAFDLAAAGIGEAAHAALLVRFAWLRFSQARSQEAKRLADRAVEIFEEAGTPDRLGEAYTLRGTIYVRTGRIAEGMRDLGKALEVTNPRTASRVYYAAVHNLAYALSQSNTLNAGIGLAYVRRARRAIRSHRRSVARAKLNWIEGLIYARLHMTARAEVLFESAFQALLDLRAIYDAALVALDLAEILALEGRWGKLGAVVRQVLDCVPSENGREVVGALHRLAEACRRESLNHEAIAAVRKVIERHLASPRAARWRRS